MPGKRGATERGTLVCEDLADKNLRIMGDAVATAPGWIARSACRPDTVGPMTVVVLDILPWDERLMLDLAPAEIGMIEIEAGVENCDLDSFAAETGIEDLSRVKPPRGLVAVLESNPRKRLDPGEAPAGEPVPMAWS